MRLAQDKVKRRGAAQIAKVYKLVDKYKYGIPHKVAEFYEDMNRLFIYRSLAR
jgi:hypothetical protein